MKPKPFKPSGVLGCEEICGHRVWRVRVWRTIVVSEDCMCHSCWLASTLVFRIEEKKKHCKKHGKWTHIEFGKNEWKGIGMSVSHRTELHRNTPLEDAFCVIPCHCRWALMSHCTALYHLRMDLRSHLAARHHLTAFERPLQGACK